jgi:hypothetical protein
MALRRATSRDPAYRYQTVTQFAEAFAGKAPTVVAAEHIHREKVIEKRRSPYALIGVIGVLAAVAVASRQSVRTSVNDWWRSRGPFTASPDIFPRDNKDGGSGTSSGSSSGPASPPPPSHPESQRLPPPGEPNNTQVGAPTPQGAASGNSSNSSKDGGRSIDIFPRTVDPASQRADTSRSGSGSRPAGDRSPDRGASQASRSASSPGSQPDGGSSSQPPVETTGILTVSVTGTRSAMVAVDGQNQGMSPLTWRGAVGRHVVTLRGVENFSPDSRTVNIKASDTARVSFTVRQP